MPKNIEQAVEAHRAGKLEEAATLYRAILKDRPQHPDANHNLGVLAVSLNNPVDALPLLKTALEANPKQGQYWISYIDALIKDNQPEIARLVLEQGKEMGLSGEQVDALNQQLTLRSEELESDKAQSLTFTQQRKKFSAKKEKKKNASPSQRRMGQTSSPSQAEVNTLLTQYQSGQYALAEKLAETMTQKHPNHQFGWKVLGVVFRATGRTADAVVANQKALALVPNDAEVHSNLGTVLQELGRLEDAEASYRQAIALKPDYAQAHSNLGNALKDLDRLEDAEASYRQAVALKSDFADAHSNLGVTLNDLGRLKEAEASYRQAISLKPDYAGAHYNLGVTLQNLSRLEEAEASYRQAIALKPEYPDAHNNSGIVLQELGRLKDAEASYRQAIALKPDYAQAHSNLGNALKDLDRLEDAEASYRQAVALKSNFSEAHSNLGVTLSYLGRLKEAEASYRQAISLKPDYAEAHYNLGVTIQNLSRLEEAEASYRQAITLKPNYAEAHSNLGLTLKELGRFGEALKAVVASIKIKPTAEAKICFVNISKDIAPKSWHTALSEMVISALVEPWDRPLSVMDFACRLLKLDAGFMPVLNQTNGHATQSTDASLLDSLVANPLESSALLHAMLSSGHIADHDLERLFTRLRRHLLMQVTPTMSDELEGNDVPTLYCYLAQQCFINEYVYFETAQEIEHLQLKLGQLEAAIEREEEIPASLVIVVACYVPLHSVLGAQSLPQRDWPSEVASVLKQQIQEPLDELALRASIPSLTNTENRVSLEVQRMYEENPYPRWVRLPKETSAQTLNARLRSLFPSGAFRALVDDRSPQILVAGCGTGQHPIGTAQSVKGANVLAIDLSMASLSYAKRKTAELGIENVAYAQADLLKLGSLGRTFDVIESSGVLHHLENPFEGWQVLLSLLKPHGLMKLGFYSEIARRDIVKVRDMITKEGLGSSAQEIRAYRKHLLELKDSDDFGMAISSSDFFSTSACRDLLFHVQEHRMTLPVLSDFFKENDLNFLGFEIDSSVKHSYKSRFLNDSSATDLNNWHIYEEENPDTFFGMYQFWIQKNS